MASAACLAGPLLPSLASDTQSDKLMSKKTAANGQTPRFDRAKLPIYLRTLFPRDTAKAVGAALNRSPYTVSNWLDGTSAPDAETFGDMLGLWDVDFICAVMTPPPEWAVDTLMRKKLAELERMSAALKAKLQATEA